MQERINQQKLQEKEDQQNPESIQSNAQKNQQGQSAIGLSVIQQRQQDEMQWEQAALKSWQERQEKLNQQDPKRKESFKKLHEAVGKMPPPQKPDPFSLPGSRSKDLLKHTD